ncbi:MAG: peptidoglycan DD-metalloendopeptidase family protein, partial [Hyphomicrobium sp.]
ILPVSGRVKQEYGALDGYGVKSRGATLTALPGSRIIAPWSGKVVFAGPFKGYGAILILQHAGDYHSLLAGFGRIDVSVGQTVTAGEPVGVMAAAKQGNWAELYFELRRDGDTVDPLAVSVARKRRT